MADISRRVNVTVITVLFVLLVCGVCLIYSRTDANMAEYERQKQIQPQPQPEHESQFQQLESIRAWMHPRE